jgi:hypothetical protein
LRFLKADDARILDGQLKRVVAGEPGAIDTPFGLWTKCDRVFANYFQKNWEQRREPLAFLLYDPPPVLSRGSPVFIYSDKHLRLTASFIAGHFVAGHKFTAAQEERLAERERIWSQYRENTVGPPTKGDLDSFWDKQHGGRALFLLEDVEAVTEPVPFRTYGRALEWAYPTGVGYRYLSLSQCLLLKRAIGGSDVKD